MRRPLIIAGLLFGTAAFAAGLTPRPTVEASPSSQVEEVKPDHHQRGHHRGKHAHRSRHHDGARHHGGHGRHHRKGSGKKACHD